MQPAVGAAESIVAMSCQVTLVTCLPHELATILVPRAFEKLLMLLDQPKLGIQACQGNAGGHDYLPTGNRHCVSIKSRLCKGPSPKLQEEGSFSSTPSVISDPPAEAHNHVMNPAWDWDGIARFQCLRSNYNLNVRYTYVFLDHFPLC